MEKQSDSIFAEASGPARGAVAVIRISGPQAGAALTSLGGPPLPEPRRASLRALRGPEGGELLDEALVVWFPGPDSFTGEDVVELHVHGGRAVRQAMAEALGSLPGLRPAEPGEFSRRAFMNGRLDLTKAEAIADLVAADTEMQRRQAVRQMAGALSELYEGWRARLVAAMAHTEAAIDFSDEPLPENLAAQIEADLRELREEIEAHLADSHRGERLREGVSIAILGRPNVGKSSLLNKLAGRDAAIVSDIAGTTRDIVEVHLDLGGLPVSLSDTAGIRDAEGEIEREGVVRSRSAAARADFRVIVVDASCAGNWQGDGLAELDEFGGENTMVIVNKVDLMPGEPPPEVGGLPVWPISCKSGAGIDALVAALTAAVVERYGYAETPVPTRARHRLALESCCNALERALDATGIELGAEDLRLGARALGRITGRVDVEELLDVVFRDFCIGK